MSNELHDMFLNTIGDMEYDVGVGIITTPLEAVNKPLVVFLVGDSKQKLDQHKYGDEPN